MSVRYATGEEALVGDHVVYLGEPSHVEDVIDTKASRESWGLEQRGVMMTNSSFGRVFEPADPYTGILGAQIEFRSRS